MNERIRQLAEQACAFADIQYNKQTKATFYTNKSVEEFFREKFAQLIVEECVGILMTPEYPMNHPEELSDYNRGWVNGRLLGIEHIREHFEVES